jgi:hypothetical protein
MFPRARQPATMTGSRVWVVGNNSRQGENLADRWAGQLGALTMFSTSAWSFDETVPHSFRYGWLHRCRVEAIVSFMASLAMMTLIELACCY